MIDVYLRLAPKSPLRMYLASAVICRWLEELDVNLHCIFMEGTHIPQFLPILCEVQLPETDFCWTSRAYAEQRAQSEFYILADDDHLIVGENWAARMAKAIGDGFGMLSARSLIHFERMESSDFTGCPCVIRKNCYYPARLDGPADRQDEITCRAMHANGFKTRFVHGVDYNHLGCGFSQVNPVLWNRC